MATVAAWRPSVAAAVKQQAEGKPASKWTIGALAALALLSLAGGAYYFSPGHHRHRQARVRWSTPPPSTPTLASMPAGPKMRGAPPPRNLAKQRADEAKRPPRPTPRANPAKASTADRPPSDPAERIRQFVRSYDGGDCFFVAPVTVAEGNATLEGYGRSAAPFAVLDTNSNAPTDSKHRSAITPSRPQQCAAISFLAAPSQSAQARCRASMSAPVTCAATAMSAACRDFGNRNVELLMVDHEGIVLSLTSLFKGDGDPGRSRSTCKRGDAGTAQGCNCWSRW